MITRSIVHPDLSLSPTDESLIDQLVPRPSTSRKAAFASLVVILVAAAAVVPSHSFQNSWNDWRHTDDLVGTIDSLDGPVGERADTNLVAVDDGRVIQWGGRGGVDDGVVFDPTDGTFTALPVPDGAGRFASSTVWTGTDAIFWGGSTSGLDSFDFDPAGVAYRPADGTWRPIAAAPVGLMDAPALFIDGKMLIAGGHHQTVPSDPASFLYDPVLDSWTEVAIDLHVATMLEVGGRVLAAGSLTDSAMPGIQTWQILEFDRQALEWSSVGETVSALWAVPFVGTDGQLGLVVLADMNAPVEVIELARSEDGSTDGWRVVRESSRANQGVVAVAPTAVWSGEVLYLVGLEGVIRYDPRLNRLAITGRHETLRNSNGGAVWTGDALVSLSSESNRGWVLRPDSP